MLKALSKPSACFCLQLCHGDTTLYLWHLRLGHIGYDGLSTIVTIGFGTGIKLTSVLKWELCDGCELGKQKRVNCIKCSPNRAKQVLEVIHRDICGPMQTATFSVKRYFVTFIDEKSHYCVTYLLKKKSEVADKFSHFVALAENQTSMHVKTLRCDNGGGYTSGLIAKFCAERDIVQIFTPPYTPQLNWSCRAHEPHTGRMWSLLAGVRCFDKVVLG